jgi:hypothetical protein
VTERKREAASLGALDSHALAALLNRGCVCRSVDHERLRHALEGEAASRAIIHAELAKTHPHLFSDTIVFVAEAHLRFMADLVAAIERIVATSAWQDRVSRHAPEIAAHPTRAAGVFLGYDFHLGPGGPQLIEINTNAGGALLNAKLASAQRACCAPDLRVGHDAVEARFIAMFREEWRRVRFDAPLSRIAIVDETPAQQFLAPEFELFRQAFEADGIEAVIAAPEALRFDGKALRHEGEAIDLVYNRLTDFALAAPGCAALRTAYLADALVVTPHPRAHALYADKRNLALLSDDAWLAKIGVVAADRRLVRAGVPRTEEVLPENAATYWTTRRHWFFKPAAGCGSKAAYRGDKLTKSVFATIAGGGYVAQALVPPSQRRLLVDGVEQDLKIDLRNYVYRGEVQLVSARLYQGQTTNFRTRGGGFAAVFPVLVAGADQRDGALAATAALSATDDGL